MFFPIKVNENDSGTQAGVSEGAKHALHAGATFNGRQRDIQIKYVNNTE